VVVANATGCLEVATSRYPTSAWNVPWIHSAFENAAATIAGVEAAYKALKRIGKIKKRIRFVAFGGDGGIINQLIKYEETESITLVEIDEEVVKAAKMFFPEMSRAFENPRVKVIFEDGIRFIDGKKEAYDVIIIDSTDPLGPAEGLFTPEFYGNVRAALKEDGLLAVQAESPVLTPELVREILKNIAIPFGAKNIWYYIGFMPTYPTGMWGFALASKGPRKPELMVDRAKKIAAKSKCYNANVHKAALSLPNFVLELLPEGAPQKMER